MEEEPETTKSPFDFKGAGEATTATKSKEDKKIIKK